LRFIERGKIEDFCLWKTGEIHSYIGSEIDSLNHRYSIAQWVMITISRTGGIAAETPIRQQEPVDNYGTWQIIKLHGQSTYQRKRRRNYSRRPFVNSQGGLAALATHLLCQSVGMLFLCAIKCQATHGA
jgi:hypothetical protein